MDSLASAAHAAGFAMALVEDGAPEQARFAPQHSATQHPATQHSATEHKSVPRGTVVLTETTARWQGSSQPASLSRQQAAASGSIFDWMPSFSWRADGR